MSVGRQELQALVNQDRDVFGLDKPCPVQSCLTIKFKTFCEYHHNVHVEFKAVFKCGAPRCRSTFNMQSKCRQPINHCPDDKYQIIPRTVRGWSEKSR